MEPVNFKVGANDDLEMLGISAKRKDELCDVLNEEADKVGRDPDAIVFQAFPIVLNKCQNENERLFIAMQMGMFIEDGRQQMENPLAKLFSLTRN